MKTCCKLLMAAAFVVLTFSTIGHSQRKERLGRVCGDPKAPCSFRKNFEPNDLPFDTRNWTIANSEFFYAVVLESRKLDPEGGCDSAFPEERRLDVQTMFPNNKVFAVRCPEPGSNYYTNVSDDVSLMAVYAGKTAAQARSTLAKIKASGRFKNVSLRRMQAGINGT